MRNNRKSETPNSNRDKIAN